MLTWPPSVHLSQGLNGQKKYQINLKSHAGPIHVLLINKEASSAKPVAFPVPPPDDLTQPPAPTPAPVPSPPGPLFCERSAPQPASGAMDKGAKTWAPGKEGRGPRVSTGAWWRCLHN